MTAAPTFHGVLLTFRRPDDLRSTLEILGRQSTPLDTLLVVDNDADPVVRTVVEATDVGTPVTYLGIPDNPGPAGGLHAGVEEVLTRATDNDWVVFFDDDDPPQRADALEELRAVIDELSATTDRLGGVGLWGAILRPSGRLRAIGGDGPGTVDYLPGGAMSHYRVAALRAADGHDPDMFFGFDDLDLGLSIRRAGWELHASGLARRHGLAHMVDGRRASTTVGDTGWRRYYSLRNLIATLRRDKRLLAPLWMSIGPGLAKPLLNLPIAPRAAWANLRVNARAIAHGWRGIAGKTVDPTTDPPRWLRN